MVKKIFLIFVISFLSCGVVNVESDKEEEWYIEAKVNGKDWRVKALATMTSKNTELIIEGRYYYNRYYFESLLFTHLISKSVVGVYDLNRWKGENGEPYGAFFAEVDWDAVIADYLPNGDPSNRMEITLYDSSSGIIEGKFQVTFEVDPNWYKGVERLKQLGITPPSRKRPDIVSFTEGRFKVRLIKVK